jgi:hypothetical protein
MTKPSPISTDWPQVSDNSLIGQIASGDVALLKGEKWHGNEGFGLIHRSPQLAAGERRLILTLDWLS